MGMQEHLKVVEQNYAKHTFTIPEKLQRAGLAKKIALRELSSDEELLASKLGNFNVLKSEYEAAKMSICALDGKETSNQDGDVDLFWSQCGPKLRALILKAHAKINSPDKEESDSFFKSENIGT